MALPEQSLMPQNPCDVCRSKTINLPDDPASQSVLDAAIALVKAKTDLIPAVPAIKPTYETISYSPGLITSNDLITGTKTISATSEASGLGNADYSSVLTLPMTCTVNGVSKVIGSTETRLAIIRIGTRSSITIDSDDGTHDLRCRIYVDAQDADHLLQDLTFTTTGNQLNVQDCLVGSKEVIFNLLKDGSAHTFYFFFWSPGNHSPVISVAQVWEGVGVTGTTGYNSLSLTFSGFINWGIGRTLVGSGTGQAYYGPSDNAYWGITASHGGNSFFVANNPCLQQYGNVATDLYCLISTRIVLRSDT